MSLLTHLDAFAGIGGFSLAAKMVGGIVTTDAIDINPYCQQIIKKNFPGVMIHDDIKTFEPEQGRFDLITAGFPCQDISGANQQGVGLAGQRSGLFYALMRVVRATRPCFLVLENVSGLLTQRAGSDMAAVLWELSESGFDAEWRIVSGAEVGAPHLRERVFIIAYPRERHDRRWLSARSLQGDYWREAFVRTAATTEAARLVQAVPRAGNGAQTTTASPENDDRRDGFTLDGGTSKQDTDHFDGTVRNTERGGPAPNRSVNHSWAVEPRVRRVVDGLPGRLDRITALGNTVIPQAAAIPLRRVVELSKLL